MRTSPTSGKWIQYGVVCCVIVVIGTASVLFYRFMVDKLPANIWSKLLLGICIIVFGNMLKMAIRDAIIHFTGQRDILERFLGKSSDDVSQAQ